MRPLVKPFIQLMQPFEGQILAIDAGSLSVVDCGYKLCIDDKTYWMVVRISARGTKVIVGLKMVHPFVMQTKGQKQSDLYYLLPDKFVHSVREFQLV